MARCWYSKWELLFYIDIGKDNQHCRKDSAKLNKSHEIYSIVLKNDDQNLGFAGIALFIGVAQFFLFLLLAELLFPNYSVSNNYISDLGVGKTAYIFNTTIEVLGIALIIAGLLLRKFSPVLLVVLILAGIGAIGVGLFPENTGRPHSLFSLLVFLMGAIAPYIIIYKLRNFISAVWVFLGTYALIFLILYTKGVHLGLGKGGMERMIVYPELLWALGFGGWLLGKSSNHQEKLEHS